MSVEFEEEDALSSYRRPIAGDEGGFLTQLIIKSGIAGGKSGADRVLAILAVIFFVLTIMVIVKLF